MNYLIWIFCIALTFSPTPTRAEEAVHGQSKNRPPIACEQTKLSELLEVWQRVKTTPKESLDPVTKEKLLQTFSQIPVACLTDDFYDEIRAALQWFGVFPCRLEDIRGPVTIILSSEIHNTPFSKAQLTKYFEAAKSGKERLVIEHTLESQVKPEMNFAGVDFVKNADGELPWSFYSLFKVRWQTKKTKLKTGTLINVLGSEPIQQTIKTLKRPLTNKQHEQLLKDTEALKEALRTKKSPGLLLISRLTGELEAKTAYGLLDMVYEAHLKRLSDSRSLFVQVPPELKDLKNSAALYEPINNWRNRNLSFSAAEAACGLKEGVVRLHMGIAHTAGTYEILRQMIATSKLENKVRLVVEKTVFEDPEIAKIMKSTDADYKREFEVARDAVLKIAK